MINLMIVGAQKVVILARSEVHIYIEKHAFFEEPDFLCLDHAIIRILEALPETLFITTQREIISFPIRALDSILTCSVKFLAEWRNQKRNTLELKIKARLDVHL